MPKMKLLNFHIDESTLAAVDDICFDRVFPD